MQDNAHVEASEQKYAGRSSQGELGLYPQLTPPIVYLRPLLSQELIPRRMRRRKGYFLHRRIAGANHGKGYCPLAIMEVDSHHLPLLQLHKLMGS